MVKRCVGGEYRIDDKCKQRNQTTGEKVKLLTEGSLFAGIGGWTLACEKFGVKSLWASEIEKLLKNEKSILRCLRASTSS